MDNHNNDNNHNNDEVPRGLPAERRVRDLDLNKKPTLSSQVYVNDDCNSTTGEMEEVQSNEVPAVVQTAKEEPEEVQSDPVPAAVQTAEASKDKGKRPMVFPEEAHDKVNVGGSAAFEENINISNANQLSGHERKRMRFNFTRIREPRIKVMIETKEGEAKDDGYRWRKYGQKDIKANNNQTRAYYRCSDKNCMIKKQVEMDGENPKMMVITYEGRHNHHPPSPLNTTNAAAAQNEAIRRIIGNANYIPPRNTNNNAVAPPAANTQNGILQINRNVNNIPPMNTNNNAVASAAASVAASSAAVSAQNAILQSRMNRNVNNIPPMNTNNNAVASAAASVAASSAAVSAQNAMLQSRMNRNVNNIPPMNTNIAAAVASAASVAASAAASAQNAILQSRMNRNVNNIPPMNTNNAAAVSAAAVASVVASAAASAAAASAQNALLRGRMNRNVNNTPPMQPHPLHHRLWHHAYENGGSSKGSSGYRAPGVVPFRSLLPRLSPTAAAVNLNRSLNINGEGTSSAPAEEWSNKVPKKNDDDKKKDI